MANTPLYPKTLIERGKWNDYRQGIWGDSFNWSWVRPWSQIKYLVIHHTVTSHDATPDDIALLHKARGWAGIGYHFVITKDGMVHYVGDISTARANVLNKNEQVIGITIVGDFTKHLPSDEQIRSAHDLCKFFLTETPSLPTLNNWSQVVGHKDLQATACPGTSWPDDMRQRIIDRRVYSPEPLPEPTPQPLPEPTPEPTLTVSVTTKSKELTIENGKATVNLVLLIVGKLGDVEVYNQEKTVTKTVDLPVEPEVPVTIIVNDPEQVIALGKIGDIDYGDMKLKDIRTGLKNKDGKIKELLVENQTLKSSNGAFTKLVDFIKQLLGI